MNWRRERPERFVMEVFFEFMRFGYAESGPRARLFLRRSLSHVCAGWREIFFRAPAPPPHPVVMVTTLNPEDVLRAVRAALAEDVGGGDATTLATVAEDSISRAVMRA